MAENKPRPAPTTLLPELERMAKAYGATLQRRAAHETTCMVFEEHAQRPKEQAVVRLFEAGPLGEYMVKGNQGYVRICVEVEK